MDAAKADARLSDVIAALTYALDITDGQPLGHAVRTCLIGMRIADELALELDDRSALFYGLLLKDAGCSSNAARIAALFGTSDLTAKSDVKRINHSKLSESLRYVVRNTDGVRSLLRVLKSGAGTHGEMTAIRCERGAQIAHMLELPAGASEAIYAVDEHWDGKGHPMGLAGEEIPLLARVLCLSQTVDVFLTHSGLAAALEMATERSGSWFDPALVRTLGSLEHDTAFWESLRGDDVHRRVAELEPQELVAPADEARLDRVAEAFARVIDAKSPFTFRHSERVASIAVAIAGELGCSRDELRDMRRAGLLHDIGKLSVSSLILDKPGALTDEEFAAVRKHPALSGEILRRVGPFAQLADVAAAHHERLDGSGYPAGLRGQELTQPMRILAVADVFEALTADRPYRSAMPAPDALELMRRDAGRMLCADALAALERTLNRSGTEALPAAA